jgi:hypothetical protein
MSQAAPRYFFIIGAMKAGTTSLFKYLADHPELCPSTRKEPRVFRDPGDVSEQRRDLERLFGGRTGEPWCFEGSTSYAKYPKFPGVPERLREAVPDARFIYLVRNPVERTWSHYVHNVAHGRENRPFALALRERPQYTDFSRYHMQLEQYHAIFPRDRVLVQVFEEMIADPGATVRTICEFLGVDNSYQPQTAAIAFNASVEKRTPTRPLRVLQTLGLEHRVPWRVRRRLRDGAPLPTKTAALTPALREQVAASVRSDTEAFLRSFGRRISAWKDFV